MEKRSAPEVDADRSRTSEDSKDKLTNRKTEKHCFVKVFDFFVYLDFHT
jgi:hypothetical protein